MSVKLSTHLPLFSTAPGGTRKLRGLIQELAVRGKLMPQDPNDEPASELLKRIAQQRAKLKAEGKKTKPLLPLNEREQPFEVPESWRVVYLGGVLEMINGKAFKPEEWRQAGVPIVRIQNLNNKNAQHNHCDADTLDERHRLSSGDFLISWSGTPGTSFGAFIWDRGEAALNQHIFRCVQVGSSFDKRFLRLAINSQLNILIEKAQGGVGLQHVTKGTLEALVLPLPPKAEQGRIVAKLDELMVLCDRLEAEQADADVAYTRLLDALLGTLPQSTDAADLATNWRRLAEHFDTLFTTESSLDVLKQTVLELAVTGKLVPQDSKDEPASELIRRIGNTKVESRNGFSDFPFEVPRNWEFAQLKDLLVPEKELSYGVIKLGVEPASGGIWTLRCSDVKPGYIDLSSVRRVSEEIECEYRRTRLSGGEIVLNIRGTLGGVAVIPDDFAGYNVAREVAVIPVSPHLNNRYLLFAMLSPYFWRTTLGELRGIAYKGLNLGSLRSFYIPIPPIAEQHRIVAKVDELMSLCDRLKTDLAESRRHQEMLASTLIETALHAA